MSNNELSIDIFEYEYRKMFGLSYEEMQNEPYDEFVKNLTIMEAMARRQKREQRALQSLRK